MNGNTKLLQLKKKLLIIGGYLLVAAGLLVYVSYSQYRITIQGTVEMPESYNIQASIDLGHALTSDGAMYLAGDTVLKNLSPGSNAEAYADAKATEHAICFDVINSDRKYEDEAYQSPLDLRYKIYVKTAGRIPLYFVTEDAEGNRYTAKAYTGNDEQELVYRFYKDAKEPEYVLSGAAFSKYSHEIYVGWDSSNQKFVDAAFRKEVDELTVYAELVALPQDHDYSADVKEEQVWQFVEEDQ